MPRHFALVALSLLLASCSSGQPGLFDFLQIRDFEDHRVEIEHPGGPIPAPEIPAELRREASELPDPRLPERGALSYRVEIEFKGAEFPKPLRKDMTKVFKGASILEQLRRSAPTDPAGLDQRMRSDLEVAGDVLQAYGFYEGQASGRLELQPSGDKRDAAQRYKVIITFDPGPRYHVGKSDIILTDAESLSEGERAELPRTLAEIGLPEGAPVVADEVLGAVGAVRQVFRTRGYPFAEVTGSRYFLDQEQRLLEVEIRVDAGERVRMGELELSGPVPVEPKYFEALQNWQPGRLWNQDVVDAYRESLRQTGLFASLDVRPAATPNPRGERNVVVEAVGALERTVGGALRYDSDLGLGLLGYWENRNLTGRGDRLRFELPIWEEKQELAAVYRLPFFLRPDQDLLLGGGVLHEDNDSYKLLTANGGVGLERRLGRHWSGTVGVRGEGGRIQEVDKKEREYYMFGLPFSLTFNDTRNPLDADKGARITLAAAPYGGYYEDYFSVVRTRLDGNFFLPLVGEDTLVLALRGVYGSIIGAESGEVPPTIRFYAGGGGSVRGYEFRSIGPRNENDDPLGGDSLVECSVELRWRFLEDWGLVFFTDGGMVYADKVPDRDEDLRWGSGLGLRYYTALGPVRFDVAFPLNKRRDDSSMQLYISIGQSF